jgi:hypothetical protein
MTVAYFAYKHMTPQARERATALLKLNPYYKKWRAEIPADAPQDEVNAQIFMHAATWPDLLRDDSTYTDDGSHPTNPKAAQNIGFADHLLHKYWHHYDMPWSTDGTKPPGIPAPNAVTQLAAFRKVLASAKTSDDLKSYDLTWTLHLVGDLHQPLHCITRVSKEEPEGDDCALKVMFNPPGPDSSLHWFWDCALGKDGADKVKAVADSLPAVEGSEHPDDLNVMDWVKDGHELAIKEVYVSPIGKGDGPFEMTDAYNSKAHELAKKRVALAGMRLANLLNRELK